MLSGDVMHFEENRRERRQPSFNFNREQGAQPMARVAALHAANHAELWINHDKAQADGIPRSPAYMD